MPVSGKFVWASSSLFFFFASFFPACSVAMLHKWDLILLPWLQGFSEALRSKQQGCWHALTGRHGAGSDGLQKSDITCHFSSSFGELGDSWACKAFTPDSFSVLRTQVLQSSCRETAALSSIPCYLIFHCEGHKKARQLKGDEGTAHCCLDAHHRQGRNHSSQ